ncbi:hypothetical protein [Treponema sp.]|uniref:hypothetical protein n=1 Tax=Treponema sp. TaxID=166 RepID=UPI0025F26387|nr:hypothetical protein [Treponema sp.]MBR4322720.1 hypothetical protein [Treponema sp.]
MKKKIVHKGAAMAILLNSQEKAFMYGENKLRQDDVQQAVNSMTYQDLKQAAASFLLLCQKIGLSPKETMGILESEVKNENLHCGKSNRT